MVNCWQGASRSATVVLAFLMMHHNMELSEVLAQVKTRRDIRPNNGFLKQLVTLENTLNQGESVNVVTLHNDVVVCFLLQESIKTWKAYRPKKARKFSKKVKKRV